ncbi:MAG: hypothetical protein V1792_02280 [Pseudomonadota bacterium]
MKKSYDKPGGGSVQAVFLGILLLVSLISSAVWTESKAAATPQAGEAKAKQGTVLIRPNGAQADRPLNQGDPVNIGDSLKTASDGKIWVGLNQAYPDPRDLALGGDSEIAITASQPQETWSTFSGSLVKGIVRMRVQLPRIEAPPAQVIVTPTALTEVIPTEEPGDFVVETDGIAKTTITVIWGKVRVKNVSEKLVEQRILRSCQRVVVELDKEPSPIMGVSSDELRRLIKKTTIPGTLPEEVPNCSQRSAEPSDYGSAQELPYAEPPMIIPPTIILPPFMNPPAIEPPPDNPQPDDPPSDDPQPDDPQPEDPQPEDPQPEDQCPTCFEPDGQAGCKPVQCDPDSVFDPSAPGCCRPPKLEGPACEKCSTKQADGNCRKLECENGGILYEGDCSCTNDPDSPSTWPKCDPEGKCPEGMECKDGHCMPKTQPAKLTPHSSNGRPGGSLPRLDPPSITRPLDPPLDAGPWDPQAFGPNPPVHPVQCPPCARLIGGRCVRKACPQGFTLDPSTCGCEPIAPGVCRNRCRPPLRLNPTTCRCEQPDRPNGSCTKRCRPPQRLNPATCQCEGAKPDTCRKVCGPSKKLNPVTCQCERLDRPNGSCTKRCRPPQRLNPATCQCEGSNPDKCRKVCGPSKRLNPATCQCERLDRPNGSCNKRCRPSQRLNPATCQCEGSRASACRKSCPPSHRLDAGSCQCVRTSWEKRPGRKDRIGQDTRRPNRTVGKPEYRRPAENRRPQWNRDRNRTGWSSRGGRNPGWGNGRRGRG